MGGVHNTLTKALDPLGATKKVFGSNDPLDLFGGATKAREAAYNKELEKARAEQRARDEKNKSMFSSLNSSSVSLIQQTPNNTLG